MARQPCERNELGQTARPNEYEDRARMRSAGEARGGKLKCSFLLNPNPAQFKIPSEC